MTGRWDSADVGCYADGAFGHQHIRDKLAGLVGVTSDQNTTALVLSLQGAMPDDAWDEDEALDMLNAHTSVLVTWTLENGDLLLVESEKPQTTELIK